MEKTQMMFLEALKASLCGEKVQWDEYITEENWGELFQMADRHHVLPLIYDVVYDCESAKINDLSLFTLYKQRTVQTVMLQTMKSAEFLNLYKNIQGNGSSPIVVKGIVCRSLYPNPDYRISGDEDILVPGQFEIFDAAMRSNGMEFVETDINIDEAYEIPYAKRGNPIYVEAHKSLFPPDSDAYGDLNRFFDGIEDRTIEMEIDGVPLLTLNYTDHLFYLICHAFKHFLHSGFGIRQVCDIILMANTYGRLIDWDLILTHAKEVNADKFAAAIFEIGREYLVFDPVQACYPQKWQEIKVDAMPLLMDILTGGIYGATESKRSHSSSLTLSAVASQKTGKVKTNKFISTLFPGAKALRGRYPYLNRKPYLLPIAWISRLLKYGAEVKKGQSNDAVESIKIGEQRVNLLKTYEVIK